MSPRLRFMIALVIVGFAVACAVGFTLAASAATPIIAESNGIQILATAIAPP